MIYCGRAPRRRADLVMSDAPTSWSSFGDDSYGLQPEPDRWAVRSDLRRSKIASQSLVAGEIIVGDDKLANAGLSAIPGEVILRLSLGRVVRSNGVRFAEALSR